MILCSSASARELAHNYVLVGAVFSDGVQQMCLHIITSGRSCVQQWFAANVPLVDIEPLI